MNWQLDKSAPAQISKHAGVGDTNLPPQNIKRDNLVAAVPKAKVDTCPIQLIAMLPKLDCAALRKRELLTCSVAPAAASATLAPIDSEVAMHIQCHA